MIRPPEIKAHPGYVGEFCIAQADGAIPNETIIRKVNSQPGDANPDGALGKVLGSLYAGDLDQTELPRLIKYFYWVEWKFIPGHAVGCMEYKIERALDEAMGL